MGAVFDRHPKSLRHAAKLHQVKARHEFRQPPVRGLLNQMRVAPVAQHFGRSARMHGEHAHTLRYPLQIIEYIVDTYGNGRLIQPNANDANPDATTSSLSMPGLLRDVRTTANTPKPTRQINRSRHRSVARSSPSTESAAYNTTGADNATVHSTRSKRGQRKSANRTQNMTSMDAKNEYSEVHQTVWWTPLSGDHGRTVQRV